VATSDHALYAYAAAAGVRLQPDLLSSGADLVGLKWEVVDPGPVTVRTYYPRDLLSSRNNSDAGNSLVTAVVVAKAVHMARTNAVAPAEFVEGRRGTERATKSATESASGRAEVIEIIEGLMSENLVGVKL
jgi:hypothetical protein